MEGFNELYSILDCAESHVEDERNRVEREKNALKRFMGEFSKTDRKSRKTKVKPDPDSSVNHTSDLRELFEDTFYDLDHIDEYGESFQEIVNNELGNDILHLMSNHQPINDRLLAVVGGRSLISVKKRIQLENILKEEKNQIKNYRDFLKNIESHTRLPRERRLPELDNLEDYWNILQGIESEVEEKLYERQDYLQEDLNDLPRMEHLRHVYFDTSHRNPVLYTLMDSYSAIQSEKDRVMELAPCRDLNIPE